MPSSIYAVSLRLAIISGLLIGSFTNLCFVFIIKIGAFDDPDVTHVEGEVDPVRDLEIISEELRLKDVETLEKTIEKMERTVIRANDKKLKPEFVSHSNEISLKDKWVSNGHFIDTMCIFQDTMVKVKGVIVEEKKHIRFADWSAHDVSFIQVFAWIVRLNHWLPIISFIQIEVLNKYLFLTSKPVVYLVNLSDKDFIRKKNKWLIKIKEWVDKNDPGASIIPFSGAFEQKLSEFENEGERKAYIEEVKCPSVLDKIIVTGYKALQLEYFFTAGPDEVRAWTIQKGTKAPQAAGRIHTDFEKGFIMAEVMHFVDFKEEGTEAGAKAAGKYRQQGRNYLVEDGDIIFFKFNAGAGLKDAKKK